MSLALSIFFSVTLVSIFVLLAYVRKLTSDIAILRSKISNVGETVDDLSREYYDTCRELRTVQGAIKGQIDNYEGHKTIDECHRILVNAEFEVQQKLKKIKEKF